MSEAPKSRPSDVGARDAEADVIVLGVGTAGKGIDGRTGARVERVAARGGSIAVMLAGGAEVTGERVLIATGRRIDLRDLGLESAGPDGTAPYIAVDENLRAADGIWAMGDVTGKALLSLVAVYHQDRRRRDPGQGPPAGALRRRAPGHLHRPRGGQRRHDRVRSIGRGAYGRSVTTVMDPDYRGRGVLDTIG